MIELRRIFWVGTFVFYFFLFSLKLQGIVAEIPSDSATSSRGRFLLFLC